MDGIADALANSVFPDLVENLEDCVVLQRAVWHALRWETGAAERADSEEDALRADFARVMTRETEGASAGGAEAAQVAVGWIYLEEGRREVVKKSAGLGAARWAPKLGKASP